MLYPELAHRDCADCEKHVYDTKTGQRMSRDPAGLFPILRGPINPAPCRTHQSCPKGTPEQSRALSDRNHQAYRHFMECRATGQFPDDPIVRRNAGIIQGTMDAVDRVRSDMTPWLAMAGALTRGRS